MSRALKLGAASAVSGVMTLSRRQLLLALLLCACAPRPTSNNAANQGGWSIGDGSVLGDSLVLGGS